MCLRQFLIEVSMAPWEDMVRQRRELNPDVMLDEDSQHHAGNLKVKLLIAPVRYLFDPAMRWAIGIQEGEGYVRVTSPLRQYNDLVAHLQINVLLRPMARSRRTPGWLTSYESHPTEVLVQKKLWKHSEVSHRTHWAPTYTRRFLDHPNSPSDRVRLVVIAPRVRHGALQETSPFD